MKLEHKVCSMEQAKKIDALGVNAVSYWIWIYGHPASKPSKKGWWLIADDDLTFVREKTYRAYSCAELGVMLPHEITVKGYKRRLQIEKNILGGFVIAYGESSIADPILLADDICEAHAKADLFIDLLEQKIIKPEDVKL